MLIKIEYCFRLNRLEMIKIEFFSLIFEIDKLREI